MNRDVVLVYINVKSVLGQQAFSRDILCLVNLISHACVSRRHHKQALINLHVS